MIYRERPTSMEHAFALMEDEGVDETGREIPYDKEDDDDELSGVPLQGPSGHRLPQDAE